MKKRIFTGIITIVFTIALCLSPIPAVAAEPTAPSTRPSPVPDGTASHEARATPAPAKTPNNAPIGENLEFCTFRSVSFSGNLLAVDPDGDLISFEITTEPRKGILKLHEDGTFVYTPTDGKKGKDYFGYRAVDVFGNKSQEATVIIKIEKQKTKITYSDMVGNGGEYSAISLAENEIFIGAQLNGQYMFEPGRNVSRGEFLAMCMNLSGTKLLTGVQKTGFADDDVLPAWVKPYVSTAVMNGYISGYSGTSENAAPIFDSDAPISYSEAAVILNRVLNISDITVVSSLFSEYNSVPVWAAQAAANLRACKVIQNIQSMSAFITRRDAADMLLNANLLLENRK